MLELGTAVLQSAHDTLPGGDDDDQWNEFSAVFVTGLVRRALVQLRDSQVRTLVQLRGSVLLGAVGFRGLLNIISANLNCQAAAFW